ncbi:MAG TPA: HEAT repeat domain-containing protein, partial [Myxococcota bacterium]
MADARAEILAALNERDGGKRRRRLVALASVPVGSIDDDTLTLLVGALHDGGDLGARTAAMEILAAIGDAALPALGRLLDNSNVGIRRLAVDTLGLSPSVRALPLLERATADANTTVRAAAIEGIARVGGSGASSILLRQLETDVPAPVALAALLGLEQLDVVAPSEIVRRWLDDALTSSAALRLLGRAGDLAAVVPSLTAVSHLRVRAAVMGIADGLERGAPPPPTLSTSMARARLVSMARGGDQAGAAAAILSLAHIGDLDGVGVAAIREDAALLLPALHRAVELAERGGLDVHDALLRMLANATDAAVVDVIRELQEAAQRRRRQPGTVRRRERVAPLGDQEFTAIGRWFADAAGLAIAADARARVEARLLPRLELRG